MHACLYTLSYVAYLEFFWILRARLIIRFTLSILSVCLILTSPCIFLILNPWISDSQHFWTIFNEMILSSTSDARIWFQNVTFVALIIIVVQIKGWFRMALFFPLLLKSFLGWMWTSTVTSPWLINFAPSTFLSKLSKFK